MRKNTKPIAPNQLPPAPSNGLVTNETPTKHDIVLNGLASAVFGFNPFGGPFGGGPFGPSIGTELNQPTTLFVNNRWYFVSNFRQLLSESYVEQWLLQAACDVPVDDAFRGGIEIKSQQLSPKQVQELKTEMERQDDLGTMAQGFKWNRLFGGAGILSITDQDPMTPLNVKAIKNNSPLDFRAVDMWELYWDQQNTEGFDSALQDMDFEFYSYYSKELHKSRVMKLKGLTAPSFLRPRLRGWGFSIVEVMVAPINQFLKANNLIFEILDEAKVDVYKMKNLANTLINACGAQKVQTRIQLANQQKNYQSAIIMDSEDDFIQKQLTFAGIADILKELRMGVASALRMPLTKLFGISAAGFSSGEDDIENYNSMVESTIRQKAKYDILRMMELRCQKLFGFIPDDLTIEFEPLRVLSSEQEETVKTQKFARLMQARTTGEISALEFRDACNKDDLLGIQLSTAGVSDELGLMDEEDPDADVKEDPGADKSDSEKISPAPVAKAKKSITAPKEAKT